MIEECKFPLLSKEGLGDLLYPAWKNFIAQIAICLLPSAQRDGDVIVVLTLTSNWNQNFLLKKFPRDVPPYGDIGRLFRSSKINRSSPWEKGSPLLKK
jgi:hypothetical protein